MVSLWTPSFIATSCQHSYRCAASDYPGLSTDLSLGSFCQAEIHSGHSEHRQGAHRGLHGSEIAQGSSSRRILKQAKFPF